MNEAQWLASADPTQVMSYLRGKVTERKLRLCVVATVRASWDRINLPNLLSVVELSEQYADNRVTPEEFRSTGTRVYDAMMEFARTALGALARDSPRYYAILSCAQSGQGLEHFPNMNSWRGLQELAAGQLLLNLRDIFGNPFRPVTFTLEWRTDTAVALARGMYESRDFSAMPMLADSLQDAGCDNDDILDHCRNDGQHVRGCWVIDLVLGKE